MWLGPCRANGSVVALPGVDGINMACPSTRWSRSAGTHRQCLSYTVRLITLHVDVMADCDLHLAACLWLLLLLAMMMWPALCCSCIQHPRQRVMHCQHHPAALLHHQCQGHCRHMRKLQHSDNQHHHNMLYQRDGLRPRADHLYRCIVQQYSTRDDRLACEAHHHIQPVCRRRQRLRWWRLTRLCAAGLHQYDRQRLPCVNARRGGQRHCWCQHQLVLLCRLHPTGHMHASNRLWCTKCIYLWLNHADSFVWWHSARQCHHCAQHQPGMCMQCCEVCCVQPSSQACCFHRAACREQLPCLMLCGCPQLGVPSCAVHVVHAGAMFNMTVMLA